MIFVGEADLYRVKEPSVDNGNSAYCQQTHIPLARISHKLVPIALSMHVVGPAFEGPTVFLVWG